MENNESCFAPHFQGYQCPWERVLPSQQGWDTLSMVGAIALGAESENTAGYCNMSECLSEHMALCRGAGRDG